MAVVTQYPALIGIDCETLLSENEAVEIKEGIIDEQEERTLSRSGYPFALALTLVFSAKESLFKALFPQVQAYMGFDSARVTVLDAQTLTLALTRQLAGFEEGTAFLLHWQQHGEQVITLLSHVRRRTFTLVTTNVTINTIANRTTMVGAGALSR